VEERFYIPRTLDDPPMFLLWHFDTAAVFLVCVILFSILGSGTMFVLGCVSGMGLSRAYSELKQEGGRGLLIRVLYWYTPSEWWFRSSAPSHVREYIGG